MISTCFSWRTCAQVDPKYVCLHQGLVRKMPSNGFGVCGGDPETHARLNLIPVSQELDVTEHTFVFADHPYFFTVFGS